MDSFEWNKVFGAVLATALLIVGVNIGVDMVMKPHHSDKKGIEIEVAENGDGNKPTGGQQADAAPDWGTVLPAADKAAGDKAHKQCLQCHTFEKGGKNGIGPNLWNIVGTKHGQMAGFQYSTAIAGKDAVWGYQELYDFVKNPRGYAPGTKMAFAGISKSQARINLIAWMREQADTPLAIPPAAPAPAPGGEAPATPPAPGTEGQPATPPADGSPAAPAPGTPAPAAPAGGTSPVPATATPPVPAPGTPPAAPPQPAPAPAGGQ